MLKVYAVAPVRNGRRRLIRRAIQASLWLALSASSSYASHFSPVPKTPPVAPDPKRQISIPGTPGDRFVELLEKHLKTPGEANEIVLDSFHPKFNDEDVPAVKPQYQVSRAHAETLLTSVRYLRAYVQGLRASCLSTPALRDQHKTTLAFTAYVDEFLRTLDVQVSLNEKNPKRLRTKAERERLASLLAGIPVYLKEKNGKKALPPIDAKVVAAVNGIQSTFLWRKDAGPDRESHEGKLLEHALEPLRADNPVLCTLSDKIDSTPPVYDLSTIEIVGKDGKKQSMAPVGGTNWPEVNDGEPLLICMKVVDAQSGVRVEGWLEFESEFVDNSTKNLRAHAKSYDPVTEKMCFEAKVAKHLRVGPWQLKEVHGITDDFQAEGDPSVTWNNNRIETKTYAYSDRPLIGFTLSTKVVDEEGPKPKWETLRVTKALPRGKRRVIAGKNDDTAIVYQVTDGDELTISLEIEDALSGVSTETGTISLSWGEHSLSTGFKDVSWSKDRKTLNFKFTVPKHTPFDSYEVEFLLADNANNATFTALEKQIRLAVTTKTPDKEPPVVQPEKATFRNYGNRDALPVKKTLTIDTEDDPIVIRVPVKDKLSQVSSPGDLELEGPGGTTHKLNCYMFSSGDDHIDFLFDGKSGKLPIGEYVVKKLNKVSDLYYNETSVEFKDGLKIQLKAAPAEQETKAKPAVTPVVPVAQEAHADPTYEQYPAALKQLVLNLNSPDFRTREAASRELYLYGKTASKILSEASSRDSRPELRSRANAVLGRIQGTTFDDVPNWRVTAPKK